jgi:Ca-activated chloride channel family protein
MSRDDNQDLDRTREALRRAAGTEPDPEARRRARDAALDAFDEENEQQRQGIRSLRRPKEESSDDKGRNAMNKHTRNRILGGVAAASVTLIAALVAWQQHWLPVQAPLSEDQVARTETDSGQRTAGKTAQQPKEETAKQAANPQFATADQASKPTADSSARIQGRAHTSIAPTGAGRLAEQRPRPDYQAEGRDEFEHFEENPVKRVSEEPVSTFSADVDTASYSFVRNQLNQGRLPQKDAVRVEEMINYFDYAYPAPEDDGEAFATHVLVQDSPWKSDNKLLHIGIKGRAVNKPPKTNLVFLLDVSGSMNSPDKLPLVKQSMELLLSRLDADDSVAIVVYAGAAGTVLEPTPASEKQKILDALRDLRAGGSTAGGEGIRRAYELARNNFDEDAVNRVMLATDGDFNVGITDREELKGFVERQKDKGIFLSVLGFGQGNYQDRRMQALAQNGNGVAAYIDTLSEAQKVLVHEATSSLYPIARDVKIQVQFNPATVQEYRLLGYETRQLKREDFSNDQVDAGDIGAGHTVTAIYEITPVDGEPRIEPSRYEEQERQVDADDKSGEYAFLRLRYKPPKGSDQSRLIERPIHRPEHRKEAAPEPLPREARFATAVAGFAQLLRGGRYVSDWKYDDALELAQANKGPDPYGYRTEFVQLIRKAKMARDM